jgi:hypothetical protein
LSAAKLDAENALPRFNMPFDLGLAIGLKKGSPKAARHSFLVLEHTRYTSQKCLSDITGQDLQAHRGDPSTVIGLVRNRLLTESRRKKLPGPEIIFNEFEKFQKGLPAICDGAGIARDELPFIEMMALANTWLKQAARLPLTAVSKKDRGS